MSYIFLENYILTPITPMVFSPSLLKREGERPIYRALGVSMKNATINCSYYLVRELFSNNQLTCNYLFITINYKQIYSFME